MPKLRARKIITKKHSQLAVLQEKKTQIANSFAKINSSLSSNKKSADQGDVNIFLDILKVAPLIELTEEEAKPSAYCSRSDVVKDSDVDSVEVTSCSANLKDTESVKNSFPSSCDLPSFTKDSATIPFQNRQRHSFLEDDLNQSFFSNIHHHSPTKTSNCGSKCQKKGFLKRQKKKTFKKKKLSKRYFNSFVAQSTIPAASEQDCSTLKIFGEINSSSEPVKPSTNIIDLSNEEEEIVFIEEVCKSPADQGRCCVMRKKRNTMSLPRPYSQPVQNKNKLAKKSNGVLTTFISRVRYSCPSPAIQPDNYELCGLRHFEDVKGIEVSTAAHFVRRELGVVSYNVLCQSTIERTRNYLYRHLQGANLVYLSWPERRKLLEIELNRLQADIFCLQEVEDVHFEEFFQPYFHRRNFLGIYKRRTNCYPDGCAIFYDANMLHLVRKEDVSYNLNRPGMDRDNVGQIAVFKFLGTKSQVCVTNTHLLFNMKRGDIKLNQLNYLLSRMQETEQLIRKLGASNRKTFVGHILTGDFNIEPMSPIYKFVIDARIQRSLFSKTDLALEMAALSFSEDLQPCTSVSRCNNQISRDSEEYEDCQESIITGLAELEHGFTLASVYEHRLADGKCETSSYHRDSICPDFIFYSVAETKSETNSSISESFIRLLKRLTLPCVQELDKACGRLPNSQSGSDHLPLLAHFEVFCSEVA